MKTIEGSLMKIEKNIPTKNKKTLDTPLIHKAIVPIIVMLFIASSVSALNIHPQDTCSPSDTSKGIVWSVTMNFEETSGKNDYVIFGEATDASDGNDIYDIPNPPAGPGPILDVYFTTNFSFPYNKLLQEIKEYPDTYKIWNLIVWWSGGDTTVTSSWDTTEVNDSDYDTVVLCDDAGVPLVDMLNTNNYVFVYPSSGLVNFQIIAIENIPPSIIGDSYPANGSTDVERPPDELNVTVEDPDGDTMDVYIRWKRHDYYHFGEWVTLETYTGVGNGTYNTINLTGNDWIWGNTTYVWSVNCTDGKVWTNETYQYTTGGSRYDVNNNRRVNFQDAGLVWIHRTSEVDYDPLYDMTVDGTVNFQDAGLTWINRD